MGLLVTVKTGVGFEKGYNDIELLSGVLSSRFAVPEFQRGYAWEGSDITDFVGDVFAHYESVRSATATSEAIDPYFFGAVITVETKIGPGRHDKAYEVIDGQQRLTTFYLTVAELRRAFLAVEADAKVAGEAAAAVEAATAASDMEGYLRDGLSAALRLVPSGVNEVFYEALITKGTALPGYGNNSSHSRLEAAADAIRQELVGRVWDRGQPVDEQLAALQRLADALLEASYVIHAGSTSETDAYRLFLVLNDRGHPLTEADLLRTKTLELLRNYGPQREAAARAWKPIRDSGDRTIKGFLRAFYSMRTGLRPNSRDLHRQFEKEWLSARPDTEAAADAVVAFADSLRDAFPVYEAISSGRWPYSTPSASAWEVDRLKRLVPVLGQVSSVPLLMALAQGPEQRFTETVLFLERFAFRYSLSGGHPSSLGDVYFRQAQAASDPRWNVGDLESALVPLAGKYAGEARFRAALEDLRYGTSRVLIRHLLTTLDSYYGWWRKKGTGVPKPASLVVFDLAKGDIDHIYPTKPRAGEDDPTLDPARDFLGNLAFLAEGDNRSARNKPFATKQSEVYASAQPVLTSQLADSGRWPAWGLPELQRRQSELIDEAMAVFRVRTA